MALNLMKVELLELHIKLFVAFVIHTIQAS